MKVYVPNHSKLLELTVNLPFLWSSTVCRMAYQSFVLEAHHQSTHISRCLMIHQHHCFIICNCFNIVPPFHHCKNKQAVILKKDLTRKLILEKLVYINDDTSSN